MIHPSLIEKISLDERQANQAVIDDLKRSYPYVGPVTVTKHAATDPACNVMRLIVRMGKPYWSSTDPQGDEMWQAVSTWLDAKLYKVGSTMANFNKSRAEKGQQTVDYGRVELDMKPYLFSMALPTTGALPEAEDLVARFRELLGSAFVDAGATAGEGFHMTYPSNTVIPPLVEIDHIVYAKDSGIVVSELATATISGTDHQALLATLEAVG